MPSAVRPKRQSAVAAAQHTQPRATKKARKAAVAAAANDSGSDLSDAPDEDGSASGSDDAESDDPNSSDDDDHTEVDMDETGDFEAPGAKKKKAAGAPRKPKAAPKKKAPAAKKAPRAAAAGSSAAPAAKAATGRKGGTAGKRAAPKRTTGSKEELSINDDNTLFNSVKDPNTALQSTAEDWVVAYQETPGKALSELVTFFIRSCGCNSTVDEDVAQDLDAIVDNLEEVQEEFKKELVPSYPLISKAASYKKFRKSLAELLERIFTSAAEADALYDEALIETFIAWISAMSSSALRAFRHTATAIALWTIGALAQVGGELKKELASATKSRDAERKKARADKARLKELEFKVKEVTAAKKRIDGAIEELISTVFVHRYRDSDPNIRTDCINELSGWMKAQPEQFMQASFFRYLGWVLSDAHPDVRGAAIKGLGGLYGRGSTIPSSVRHFTDMFKQRLVEMAVGDVDLSVRIATIGVLVQIDKRGLLEDEQRDSLAAHIYDVEPRVRVAVAGFVTGMLEALVDEQKEQLGEEPSSKQTQALEAYETELAKLRLKCFAELLVRFAARLDKPAGDENGDAAESSRAKEQADELSWSLGGLEEGRVGLAVNALWDAVEGAQQWRPLIELLLYDHSGAGASAAPGRAKGKKGKSAAASAAGSSSNSSADTAVTGVQLTNQVYRLEPEEEAVLVEALVAVLSKTKAQAANAGPRPDRPAHGPLSDEDEAAEDDPVKSLASMTRDLIPALPKLFSKYRTDAPRIADVLLVPRYMNLELYLEAQQSTAYEALWDEISDQFLRHVEPALLANAVAAISRLVQTDTLANVNATKLTALHENLTAALREPVQGRDVEAAAFDENEIHLLMACTRRMRHLARVTDMSAAIEDDEKGSQTSAWNIVLGLASRGRLGYPDESQLIENSLGVLSLYIMWKTHAVVQTQDHAQKNALVEALVDKRDTLLDLMNSFVAGSHGNTASGVQQEAFRHTLDVYIMHGNMAAASDAAEAAAQQNGGADAAAAGRPKLPAAMRLECPVEVQHRCAGFIQAELERYAEELRASFPSDAPADAESELSDAEEEQDEDDDGNSPAPAPKKGKKGKKAAPATAAAADKTPARPTQEFLQRQQQLCQTLSHFIAAIRLGTFDVKHAAGVLAYHGRLGHIFDSCSKVLVETLREEGVYAGRPDMACNVILDALKQSAELWEQDPTTQGGECFVGLARALSSALLVRGAHLTVLRAIPAAALVRLHNNGCVHVIKRLTAAERAGNQASKTRAIAFWKGLALLLPAATGRDAVKIKSAMDQALKDAEIEVPPSAKAWEPQRSYEKRLVNLAAKSQDLRKKAAATKPASSRKKAPAPADDLIDDAELSGGEFEELEPGAEAPRRPALRPSAAAGNKRRARDDDPLDLSDEEHVSPSPGLGGDASNGGLLDITREERNSDAEEEASMARSTRSHSVAASEASSAGARKRPRHG